MRGRYKLLLIIIISFLLVFFIYTNFYHSKSIYVAIGSNLNNGTTTYNYMEYIIEMKKDYEFFHYSPKYLTVQNILDDINNNTNNINYYIKNASLITICFDSYELNNYELLDENIIIDYLNNVYEIISMIRKLNQNKIVLINVYDDNYMYINKKLYKYSKKYNIEYLELDNTYNIDGYSYLLYKDHKALATSIVNNT